MPIILKVPVVPARTYATEANMERAIAKAIPHGGTMPGVTLRYFIAWNAEGRCFPVFIGEAAIQAGVHHLFNVVG